MATQSKRRRPTKPPSAHAVRCAIAYRTKRDIHDHWRQEEWGGLSTRAINCFRYSGVGTLAEALALSNIQVWHLRNMGAKSFTEIMALRERLGTAAEVS